ncbi:MAG: DUF362 domain-containing protein [Chloroflexota bacterium]|nr:DUF362 domain-containing protein [Chloroflexota bacterium]
MSNISLTHCPTYDLSTLNTALRRLLEPLGGISAFVEPGQRVLLKPNLLIPARPERAITTHPAIVEAMVGLVREAGGEPFIADSPGGPLHNQPGMRRLYRDTGLKEVAERTGVPLHYDGAAVQVPTPDGLLLKRLDLLNVWQEADVIIALPKLKTHGLTTITGATKILFGLIPGMTKSGYHSKLADLNQFCDMLLDIVACVRPALFVMDGVLGMEGNGPSLQGSPRHVGVLLAGQDAVAMDAVVCQIIGLDPDRLPLFRAAERRGWWPEEVTVAGTPVAEVAVPDFRLPDTTQAATRPAGRGWLSQLATRALVPLPVPKRGRCTACRTCVRICPRQAITIVDQLAVVDGDLCIRCYCCHEVCPEAAIDLEFSRLGRLLRWTGVLGRPE